MLIYLLQSLNTFKLSVRKSLSALVISSCPIIFAQEPADTDVVAEPEVANEAQPPNSTKTVTQGIIDDITNNIGKYNLAAPDLATSALNTLNALLEQSELNRDAIYSFARQINRNIEAVAETEGNEDDKRKLLDRVRGLTRPMIEESYSDAIFYNDNLTDQIERRMPYLIQDSLNLVDDYSVYSGDDFGSELNIITNRYLNSKRFAGGLGVGFSYLPRLNYNGISSVDLSPYATDRLLSPDKLPFGSDLSNRSFQSLIVSARIPLVTLEVGFPSYKDSVVTNTVAQYRDIDSTTRDIRYRTSITSELEIDYDFAIKFRMRDLFYDYLDWLPDGQVEYGVLGGATGFRISDSFSTDIRFDTGGNQSFDQLTNDDTIVSAEERSFSTLYYGIYYDFLINDQMQTGISYRKYHEDKNSVSGVEVSGSVLSLNFQWIPTSPKSFPILGRFF